MRVWIVSRQDTFGWDEIEGAFLHRDDAIAHLHALEKDFPSDEFAMEGLPVIE